MPKINKLTTYDLRFPTSDHLDGSDAMHPDPDYSAAYVIIETDDNSKMSIKQMTTIILLLLLLVGVMIYVVWR